MLVLIHEKNDFAEVSKNVDRSENNIIKSSKELCRTLKPVARPVKPSSQHQRLQKKKHSTKLFLDMYLIKFLLYFSKTTLRKISYFERLNMNELDISDYRYSNYLN